MKIKSQNEQNKHISKTEMLNDGTKDAIQKWLCEATDSGVSEVVLPRQNSGTVNSSSLTHLLLTYQSCEVEPVVMATSQRSKPKLRTAPSYWTFLKYFKILKNKSLPGGSPVYARAFKCLGFTSLCPHPSSPSTRRKFLTWLLETWPFSKAQQCQYFPGRPKILTGRISVNGSPREHGL